MPDQGEATSVPVGISKEVTDTCGISFIEVLPLHGLRPGVVEGLWQVGLVRVRVGPLCPACGRVTCLTTRLTLSITTTPIDNNKLHDILIIQDGWAPESLGALRPVLHPEQGGLPAE